MRVLGWVAGAGLMMAVAAGLAAQQVQVGNSVVTFLPSATMTLLSTCPIGFRAEVDPRLTMREVKNGKKDADSTLVQLIFEGIDRKKSIVSASVTAHGVAPQSEWMLVGQKPNEERTQAFELKQARGLFQAEINVTAVPFVRWMELNQVTYADGSVWHAVEGTTCKSVLSRFHPV